MHRRQVAALFALAVAATGTCYLSVSGFFVVLSALVGRAAGAAAAAVAPGTGRRHLRRREPVPGRPGRVHAAPAQLGLEGP